MVSWILCGKNASIIFTDGTAPDPRGDSTEALLYYNLAATNMEKWKIKDWKENHGQGRKRGSLPFV